MALIVGLGNPEPHYHITRHNAGWRAVEVMAQAWSSEDEVEFRSKSSWSGRVAEVEGQVLLQPTTYMNDSGKAVAAATKSLAQRVSGKESLANGDVQYTQLFVCFDDLDLELGNWKIQFGRGPKVHNGLSSIIATLGTDQFWTVRLGVDGRHGDRTLSGSEYVLRPFLAEEKTLVEEMYLQVAKELQTRLQKLAR
jgi:peptidyl-tRNA hydrolase, PTH1 family